METICLRTIKTTLKTVKFGFENPASVLKRHNKYQVYIDHDRHALGSDDLDGMH